MANAAYFTGGPEGQALVTSGSEGVVAKQLDAPYMPGQWSTAWVKHKHFRRERFVVAGWRERDGEPEFLLSRRREGALLPGGSASLGLDTTRRQALLAALAGHERAILHRGSIRWAEPVIEVTDDVHGPQRWTVA